MVWFDRYRGTSAEGRYRRTHLAQILDPFFEDGRLNVHAGELEVRPPGSPTTGPDRGIKDSAQPFVAMSRTDED